LQAQVNLEAKKFSHLLSIFFNGLHHLLQSMNVSKELQMLARVKYSRIEQHKTQINKALSRQFVLYLERSSCFEAKI